MKRTLINGRWPLLLPNHRAARPEWPVWEIERIAAMYDHIEPGDLIVDIGAEEGDMSALWASWGASVVLVEPNPKAWPCIRATFEANDLDRKVAGWYVGMLSDDDNGNPGVVGDDGWPYCAYDVMVPDHGFHHLAEHSAVDGVTTLDALAADLDVRPDVLTLDVEGGELHVLRGAARTLEECRPAVFVSVHHDFMADLYGQDSADLFVYMDAAGYESTYLATDHERHEMFLPR